jgi:hypothetical protein
MIDCKNQVLPVGQCRNALQRISIDFAKQSLAEKLPAVPAGNAVVVVMEGVFIYLSEAQISETMRALQHAFPGHTLICDLTSGPLIARYGKTLTQQIEALGATFKFLVDEPSLIFRQAGYRLGSVFSIITKSLEFANDKVGLFIVTRFMRALAQGYAVHVFEAPASMSTETNNLSPP